MATERLKVLQMVADGTINVEEAEKLLEALGENESPEESPGEDWDHVEVFRATGQGAPRVRVRGPRHRERIKVKFRDSGQKVGSNPGFDRLVRLGMFGVTPEYMKQVKESGLGDLTFEQIITLGKFGVSPQYIVEMRDTFGEEMSFEKIVALGKFGVSSNFVKELKDAGLEDLEFEQVIQLAKFGISPSYVKAMRDAGVMDFAESLAEGDEDEEQDDEDHELAVEELSEGIEILDEQLERLGEDVERL